MLTSLPESKYFSSIFFIFIFSFWILHDFICKNALQSFIRWTIERKIGIIYMLCYLYFPLRIVQDQSLTPSQQWSPWMIHKPLIAPSPSSRILSSSHRLLLNWRSFELPHNLYSLPLLSHWCGSNETLVGWDWIDSDLDDLSLWFLLWKYTPIPPVVRGVYFSKKMINIFYKIIPPIPPFFHTPNLIYIPFPYSSSFIS